MTRVSLPRCSCFGGSAAGGKYDHLLGGVRKVDLDEGAEFAPADLLHFIGHGALAAHAGAEAILQAELYVSHKAAQIQELQRVQTDPSPVAPAAPGRHETPCMKLTASVKTKMKERTMKGTTQMFIGWKPGRHERSDVPKVVEHLTRNRTAIGPVASEALITNHHLSFLHAP